MLETIKNCRSCQSNKLLPILELGSLPLANSLLSKDQLNQEELKFPLSLVFCADCALVQILETVSPDVLFSHYLYFSSFSDTMVDHAKALVERLIPEYRLDKHSAVMEIASNDGYLLQFYKQQGVPVLGIEPAENIARVAEESKGIPTLVEFFNESLAQQLAAKNHFADIVHAHNVFAHVPNPNEFVAGLKIILKPNKGVAVIEAPYLVDFIENREFDTIYHEHFSYYSLTAVNNLVQRHSLSVVNVEHVDIHGGSLRYFIAHEGTAISASVTDLLKKEEVMGVKQYTYYQVFAERVLALRDDLLGLLRDLKKDGKKIAAYGASAKGSTLLNFFGIGKQFIDYVFDRSTIKQNHYTPGGKLPIYSPDQLIELKPDYLLLLTWNFKNEILKQQAQFHQAGGKFIIPIPEVEVC
jgi:SAM-dependent methyltransferase